MSESLRAKLDRSFKPATGRFESQQVLDAGQTRSRRNLWSLTGFLLLSIGAYSYRDLNLFEAASEPLRQLLGCPPPATLVSGALVLYGISNLILTLTAMAGESEPASPWRQFGYRGAFFLFYSFSGSLASQFIPVLLVGLSLYGLDQLHIWLYNSRQLQQLLDR